MKKILIPLLALILLCISVTAPAEGSEAITLEVNTEKLPVYAADDPYLAGFGMTDQPEGETLPVLVLAVKKSLKLQVTVQPKTVKNKKVTLSADNEELVQVRGNIVTGLKPGETVLTFASEQDPSALVRYRVFVFQPVTRIEVTAAEKSVAVGQSLLITPAFIPEDATRKEIAWSSANEKIAVVDENGNVTGMKRGNARIVAAATDGSNVRANLSVKVTQTAREITLDKSELTVDIGRTAVLKATVLPKDTDDKTVVWSSSDERIATVNKAGRITGVSLGECRIICTSVTTGEVWAQAAVHVQQPVTKVTFGDAPTIYAGESAQLTWTIEPADATNQAVSFRSGNEKILTVSEDGTITAIKAGDTYVNVITTDGSNRQARIKIRVYQHVTGVHMKRKTAYIDLKTTSTAGAILEPENSTNHNMTWESDDPSIATAEVVAKQRNKVSITGVRNGETVVRGTTEDGGFKTSIRVKVGDFSHLLKILDATIGGKGQLYITVKNVSEDLPISYFKMEIEMYEADGTPVNVNTKDGSNIVQVTYNKWLNPGKKTAEDQWMPKDYNKDISFQAITVRIVEYQIDNDWVKVLPKNRQPKFVYKKR